VATQPDVITLHLGTNDCAQDLQPATLLTNMDHLLNLTFSAVPTTHVFLASILYMPEYNQKCALSFNAMLPDLVKRHASYGHTISYVPMAEETGLCAQKGGAVDAMCCKLRVHPNSAGYLRMASVFSLAVLREYNTPCPPTPPTPAPPAPPPTPAPPPPAPNACEAQMKKDGCMQPFMSAPVSAASVVQ
jgi:hypothetical protein